MKDEHWKINILDSSHPYRMTGRHILAHVLELPSRADPQLPTGGKRLDHALTIDFGPFPGVFPFPTGTSWDHLPNKLLELESLSQDLLLGESKRRSLSVLPGLLSVNHYV